MVQVGEASFFTYHPVVEAHVRVYAVLHEEARTAGGEGGRETSRKPERAFFQTRVMRLTNPNDELGGMMFLATPQVRPSIPSPILSNPLQSWAGLGWPGLAWAGLG